MGTISHLPRRDRPQPRKLESEIEAEAACNALVAEWRKDPDLPFATRRETLKCSGLAAVSLKAETGGLDCSNALLVMIVGQLQRVDPLAADALARHYTVLEHFRVVADERFYRQLSEQVLSGELFTWTARPEPDLQVSHEDFQSLASGEIVLPPAALWADWIWHGARSENAGNAVEGLVLVPSRAAVLETRFSATEREIVVAGFRSAPVAHGLWGQKAALSSTGETLDHLLEAARISERIDPDGRAASRLKVAGAALKALVGKAAAALDHAQVDPAEEAMTEARRLGLEAALFAADLIGDATRYDSLAGAYTPRD